MQLEEARKGKATQEMKEVYSKKYLDWERQFELSLDPERARRFREKKPSVLDPETCSMCSELCALKVVRDYLKDN